MEQAYYSSGTFIQPTVHQNFHPHPRNQRYPPLPVDLRLHNNQHRKQQLQKQKHLQNIQILQRRKQKQQNVLKILREKHEARDNAKLIFASMQKTYHNKINDDQLKENQIENKILECRFRADQYRTMYQRKLYEDRVGREKSVRARRERKDQKINDRSLNHHLAEWRTYEKKIAQKYRGQERKPNRIYENHTKKLTQLTRILQQSNQIQSSPHKKQYQTLELKPHGTIRPNEGFNPTESNMQLHQEPENQLYPQSHAQSNVSGQAAGHQLSNPIYSIHEIGSFGLSKSIKNPEKMMKEMKQFLVTKAMVPDVLQDEALLDKFQEFLDQWARDDRI